MRSPVIAPFGSNCGSVPSLGRCFRFGGNAAATRLETNPETRASAGTIYPIVGIGGGAHIFLIDAFSIDVGLTFDYAAPHSKSRLENGDTTVEARLGCAPAREPLSGLTPLVAEAMRWTLFALSIAARPAGRAATVPAMLRPLACAALLCPWLALGCSDDAPAEDAGTQDASSTETASGATDDGTQTDTGSGGSTSDDPTTGVVPGDCVVQQGEGVCMVETLVPVPSPEVTFGDFDGDGDVDMLARSEETGPQDADEAVLFTNNGGTFDGGVALSFGSEPMANDRPVALSRPRPAGSQSSQVRNAFMQGTYGALGDVRVDVWWVQGSQLQRFYEPTGSPPAGPWFGDFDGDGSTDLAFAPDASSLDALALHSCTGQDCGAPQDTAVTGAPSGPWTVLGTDTTGDGQDELLVVREGDNGLEVIVFTNEGGSFASSSTLELGSDLAPSSARIEDVDADGRGDLVLTSTGDPMSNTYGATLHVFNQDGGGGLQDGPVIEAGERITGYAVADFDGDGIPDIGLRRTDLAIVNVGLGPGFSGGVSYEISAMTTGIVGQAIPTWQTEITDLDGDGSLDIVTISAQGKEAYAANVLLSQ